MNKDTLDDLFKNLNGEFDINEPTEGHQARFIQKLNTDKDTLATKSPSKNFWKPFLAIAASIVICLSVFVTINNEPEVMDLASVSPELSNTQDFFSITITEELKKLNAERSPLTEGIIHDALRQITTLEKNYEELKQDLTESGNDNRVIYAMISNFQSRIDILNQVLEQIKDVKNLNTNSNETTNTL